jgi:ubiquitin carboxyl-terminal hydrolase 14
MQQDAEECWTQITLSLGQKLPKIGSGEEKPSTLSSVMNQLFGGEMSSDLVNEENPEEPKVSKVDNFHKLSCHISKETNFLMEGLKEGLLEHVTKQSESLGREAKYLRTSKITRLPYYLTVQFVRFFWRQDKQLKAKIVRPVEFPLQLDIYDLCSDELKTALAPNRKILQEQEEKQAEAVKKQKTSAEGKEEKEEVKPQAMELSFNPEDFVNNTAQYELFAVLTHKGRMADAGHYVAWVKEAEDKWIKYDDDQVSYCNNEEIKKLSGKGGGDWHMAYMVVYRTRKVPQQ